MWGRRGGGRLDHGIVRLTRRGTRCRGATRTCGTRPWSAPAAEGSPGLEVWNPGGLLLLLLAAGVVVGVVMPATIPFAAPATAVATAITSTTATAAPATVVVGGAMGAITAVGTRNTSRVARRCSGVRGCEGGLAGRR